MMMGLSGVELEWVLIGSSVISGLDFHSSLHWLFLGEFVRPSDPGSVH